jgi:S1-C subfamily serine protease
MYDDFDLEPRRRLTPAAALPAVAAATAVLAVLVSGWAVLHSRTRAAALEQHVAAVEREVAGLRARDQRLAGRIGTTETALARKEAGIAPLARRVLKSVFTIETDGGYGTGFVGWRANGQTYLITAEHVVEDAHGTSVTVNRKGGSWEGEIIATDPKNDLAVVRISARPKGAAPLWQRPQTKLPRAGEELLLVGSPFGLEGTVTTGVVSRATKRWIQTDAAANPGNSGGPAMSRDGRIVGVLVSGGGQNVNFAVPIARVCLRLRRC